METARAHRFFGLHEDELWRKIEANNKSIRGIPEIPADIQALFGTAHDIPVEIHVRMQAAFQSETDNAVSKTINLPHTASLADVETAFRLAQRLGCKGITVYRDGSRQQQVLNLVSDDKKVKRARNASIGVSSEYFEIKTGHGPLHVHIDFDETGPFRISASIEPVGSELAGLAALTGILLTKYLEQGGSASQVLANLNSIRGDRPLGLGPNKVNSISHGIGLALKNHLKKHGWLEDSSSEEASLFPKESESQEGGLELWALAQAGEKCPRCLSPNVTINSGCSGPLCQDCGYSECH
jgi:ribonucleoside-diphosphate reductase alpha chain